MFFKRKEQPEKLKNNESSGGAAVSVVDIRYSINYWPNSVTAAEFAAEEMGATNILFEALYSPASDEDDEDCFLLTPPMSPEYEKLIHTPWSTWYYDFVINKQFSIPDVLDEITAIVGIETYWIYLKATEESFDTAMVKLREIIPAETTVVLVDNRPLPTNLPDGVFGCDPTGNHKYTLLSRPVVLSEDAVLMSSKPDVIELTFSIDGHPAAKYQAVSLP